MVSIAHYDLFVLWLFSALIVVLLMLVARREYKTRRVLDLAITSILLVWTAIHSIHTLLILMYR